MCAGSVQKQRYRAREGACSDALYKVEPRDKAKLVAVLKSRGMSDADVKKVRCSYFRRRCRHCIPDPQTLVRREQQQRAADPEGGGCGGAR